MAAPVTIKHAPTNEAFRGNGQLFIQCVACSSKGTVHTKTVWIDKQEFLTSCPWCNAQMNIQVQALPDGQKYPDW